MTTKVFYHQDREGNFQYILVKDHADYKEKGKDIVCAGISAVINGTVNFLHDYYRNDCQISHLPAQVIIYPTENSDCQLCLRLMLYQLKNISLSYPLYLKVNKHEVNTLKK